MTRIEYETVVGLCMRIAAISQALLDGTAPDPQRLQYIRDDAVTALAGLFKTKGKKEAVKP